MNDIDTTQKHYEFMEPQLIDANLTPSAWQALHQIDQLLGQPLSWTKRLEKVNHVLLKLLNVDAVWLMTFDPLPLTAYGLMSTPLAMAPDAQVHIVDNYPPLDGRWLNGDALLGRVVAGKKPYFFRPDDAKKAIVENGKTDLDLGDVFFGAFEVTPAAIVPLLDAGQPVGVLIMATHNLPDMPLCESEQFLFTYLGEYLGVNLKNAYLVERSQKHMGVLRGLNEIAQTITSSLDIDEVIQRTMAGINRVMDVEAGSLLLKDEETGELYFKITLRGENKQITAFRLRPGEGIAGWVVAHNQPTICNKAATDNRFSSKIDQAIGFITETVLCVPLLVQGKPIGVLEMINKYSGPFDEDDQELLISLAASLGIALKNANLYESAWERARRSEAINEIAAAINAARGLSETCQAIFDQFSRLLSFDHMSISLLDDSKENIHQWTIVEHGCIEQKQVLPYEASTLASLMDKNEAHIDADLSPPKGAEHYPDDEILLQNGVRARIALPLATQKSPYGILSIGHRSPATYGLYELSLLEQLAPQVAVAIEKARLIDIMEQHASELQMLNRLGEMLASTTDLNLIVDTTLSMIPRLLPGDVKGIVVAGEQGTYLGVAVPYGFTKTEKIIQTLFDTFAEISEGKVPSTIVSSRTLAGNMPVPNDWKPATVLSLPILTREGALGIIYMASGKKEIFRDDLLRIFSLVVSQISAAVENARLFQQVEQERARLAAILSSSTDAILVVNKEGRIVLVNPAACEVMEATTSQSGQLLAESTENRTLAHLFETAMQGGKSTGEVPLLNDDRTFFANLSPVALGEGDIIGWVATMQDVSHFKELDQLKSDFVNSVSHDLRSPLAGILIATKLLPDIGQLNEKQLEFLQAIESRVGSMSQLIDDLLDVGKIEAGIDMEMEPYPLSPIIVEVANFFIPQAKAKAIQVTNEVDKGLPLVLANPVRLRQVIHNLIGNAIKYTPHGGRVTIKAHPKDDEVWIEVTDTGIGIPAADQPRVFEKFYRVRGEHVREIKGTGLGLAITKSIVEKHQGRLWLQSTFGQGSTFIVALPVYDPAE